MVCHCTWFIAILCISVFVWSIVSLYPLHCSFGQEFGFCWLYICMIKYGCWSYWASLFSLLFSSFSYKTSSFCSTFMLSPKLPPPPPPPPPPPYKSPSRRIHAIDTAATSAADHAPQQDGLHGSLMLLSPSSCGNSSSSELMMPTNQLLLSPASINAAATAGSSSSNGNGNQSSSLPLSHSVRRKLQEKVRLRNRENPESGGGQQRWVEWPASSMSTHPAEVFLP